MPNRQEKNPMQMSLPTLDDVRSQFASSSPTEVPTPPAKAQGGFRRGAQAARAASNTGPMVGDATDRQKTFIRTLLAERVGNADAEVLRERLNVWLSSGTLSKAAASHAIEGLLAIPKNADDGADETERPDTGIDPKAIDPRNLWVGVYTVPLSEDPDDYRAFEVEVQPVDAEFAPNKTVISWLVGPERKPRGLGFLVAGQLKLWKSQQPFVASNAEIKSALDRLMAWDGNVDEDDPMSIKVAKHCARCGDLLTRPDSIERGIGPWCVKQDGWNF